MDFSEKVAKVAEVAEKLFFSFQSSVFANLRSKIICVQLRPAPPLVGIVFNHLLIFGT
jgi:hypothetical protein